MKIILKDEAKVLTFSDVPVNQFFVYHDCLYQKTEDVDCVKVTATGSYNARQITDNKGRPYGNVALFMPSYIIQKIIEVERIEI